MGVFMIDRQSTSFQEAVGFGRLTETQRGPDPKKGTPFQLVRARIHRVGQLRCLGCDILDHGNRREQKALCPSTCVPCGAIHPKCPGTWARTLVQAFVPGAFAHHPRWSSWRVIRGAFSSDLTP